MSAPGSWTVRRSRLPDAAAATLVAASGVAGLMVGSGWLWWAGAAGVVMGSIGLVALGRGALGVGALGLEAPGLRRPVLGMLGLGMRSADRAARGDAKTVRIHLGDAVRLESAGGVVIAEGRLDGSSVVTPWLIALRIRSDGGRRRASLVLDPWSAPPDDLRSLRVRLLGDESLRV